LDIKKRKHRSNEKSILTFMEFIKELLMFIKARKNYWLVPIILISVILGSLLVLTQGSVVAPFIYTLF